MDDGERSAEGRAPGRETRIEEELELRNRELEALHRISELALSQGALRDVFAQIAEEISEALRFPIVIIKRYDEDRGSMVLEAAHGLPEPLAADALEVPLDQTLSGRVVQTGQTLVQAHVWGESAVVNKALAGAGVKTLVVVPMLVGQQPVGALTLAHAMPVALDNASLRLAASLANFVALLTERLRAERALQQAHGELEQRIAERTAELAASEAKWRSLVENAPSTILTVDSSGTVTLASRGIGHRSIAEVVGADLFGLLQADNEDELREALKAALSSEEGRTVEISSRSWGERRWYSLRIGPIRSEGGVFGAVLIMSDVTQRRLLEEQLRQSSKMEAIGLLAGGVAHDFNNVLTVINGYSQFVLEHLASDDPLRPDIEEILQAGERGASLTRHLLAFSRRQVLEMRVMDLNQVIEATCTVLNRVLGENIQLVLRLQDHLWPVQADPGQVEQVLLNLALNARDAMPAGGALIIETENVELDEEFAARGMDFRPGQYARLVISDTGCGMTPEIKAHLFEPFYTTKGPGKGTGLGLATVYGIVRQFGGSIYVYSEPGHGAVFKIYLPRYRHDESSKVAKRESAAHSLPTGSEVVLVVEDEPEVRLFTVRMLERLGYTVLEAAQASEALRLFSNYQVDLVLADVVMPEMSGAELVRRLGEVRNDFKVLYISGYTGQAIEYQQVLQPGMSFVEKPFSLNALARSVREALDL